MDFKERQKTQRNLPESNKQLLQRQNINSQIIFRFTTATNLKIGTYVLTPNFTTQKKISKKLQPLRKRPYQIIDKPTDVTYKLTDLNKKEIVQHRNTLLPYYPKEYALRELTKLYSFTDLKSIKIVQNKNQIKTLICKPYKNNQIKRKKKTFQTNIKKVDTH